MSIHDITPLIDGSLAVFPGDTPASREVLLDLAKGAPVTLSTLRTTVHLGAHADGANHYGLGARSIDCMPLEHYLGACQVVEAGVGRNARALPADLRSEITEMRVLLRTGTYPNPHAWNADFAGLSVELVEFLASKGVRTIGIDTPSVDLSDSKDLLAHHAILRHGIAILEGLVLDGIKPGRYELIALPLKLAGFDGSPVRAVLRDLDPA